INHIISSSIPFFTPQIIRLRSDSVCIDPSRHGGRVMKRALTFAVIATLLVFSGCKNAKQARSPETDALFHAAAAGDADTVRELVASPNVDINALDEDWNTPLMQAAREG